MSNCAPIIYPNFTPAQIITGPPDIFVFRAHNNIFRNYSIQAGNDFNLIPHQTRNGGSYQLLVKKTIAGDVIINLPANGIVLGDTTATSITLSGAQNEDFLIEFSFDGTNLLFWSVGSGQEATGLASIKTVTASSYALESTDNSKYVRISSVTNIIVTIPAETDVNLPVGTVITFEQTNVGQLLFLNAMDVVLNTYLGPKTAGQYHCVQLIKVASNTWTLIGGVA